MIYEFGVMSSKFRLEAQDDKMAFTIMCLICGNVPIAVYSPVKKVLNPIDYVSKDNEQYFKDNIIEMRKVHQSVEKVL